MSTLKPFHIAYREWPGMEQVFGEKIPKLVSQVEVYATGLVAGNLRGGPLLAALEGGEGFVLGWVQGVPHARGNVWEAWGVVAPSIESVRTWPSHWATLKREPSEEHLGTLVELIEKGWGNSWPPLPDTLDSLLSRFHREHLSASQAMNFKVPIHQQGDIGALAWLWFLGPISWKSATIGPPHRNPVISRNRPSYEGIIDEPRPESETKVSPFIATLLELVRKGDLGEAERAIEAFRAKDPATRRTILMGGKSAPVLEREGAKPNQKPQASRPKPKSWLNVVSAIVFNSETETETESTGDKQGEPDASPIMPMPLMPQERRLRVIEWKINALLAAVFLLSMASVMRSPDINFGSKKVAPPPPPSIAQIQDTPISTEEEKEEKVIFDQATLNSMASRLKDRLNLTAGPGFQSSILARTSEVDLRRLLAHSATQIRLSEAALSEPKCRPAIILIDGNIGPKTQALLDFCDNQDVKRLAQSEEEALKWLHAWLGLTPTRR